MSTNPVPAAITQRVSEYVELFFGAKSTAPDLLCDRHPADVMALRVIDAALDERVVTYGELRTRSRQVASVLEARGVGPGDRVATLMGKHVDLPAVILGIWRLGAVYVPLFTAFAANAVADRLERSDTKVVITDPEQISKIPIDSYPTLIVHGGGDATAHWTASGNSVGDLLSEVDAAGEWTGTTPSGGGTPIVHMFTSGTTGKPKTVVHPLSYIAGWLGYLEFGLGVEPEDVYWNAADPGWAYGLYGGIVAPLAAGYTSVIHTPKFDADAALAVLDKFSVSNFAAAPTVYRALRSSEGSKDLPSLRRLSSAGEPLTPDIFYWARQEWGLSIHDHFGQTELGMCAGFAHHNDVATAVVSSSMGRALPGWSLTALGSDDDHVASPGEVGRLAVIVEDSSFYTFTGYGTHRDAPGDRITHDGRYYVTGDLVRVDDDGLIHFCSRDDDVILMAGYRIGPFDVESALGAHGAVLECAVVAAPDQERGEVIHAFVVTTDSATADAALESELQNWVKANYAAHAYPRSFSFVDALPKTPSGKVQRNVLRTWVQESR